MTPDLDEMLRRYLEREESDPLRARLQHLTDWQSEHEHADKERHQIVVATLDAHHYRLQTLEHGEARRDAERACAVTTRMGAHHYSLQADRDSSMDLAEYVGREVSQRVEAETKNPSTPPPDAAQIASISKDVMAAALVTLKAEQWDKLEAERKAAEKARTRAKWSAITGAVTTALAFTLYLVEHFTR